MKLKQVQSFTTSFFLCVFAAEQIFIPHTIATIENSVKRTSLQSKHSTGLILVHKAPIRELLMIKGNL